MKIAVNYNVSKYNYNPTFCANSRTVLNSPIAQYMQILCDPVKSQKMKQKGIKVLKNDCINQINNQKLRELCEKVLEKSPVEMFVVSASSQGKNHPADEFAPGTMIKHVKRVFQMCKYSIVRHGLNEYDGDCALTAAILHDFPAKFIPDGKTAYKKDIDHAVKNAIFVEDQMKKMNFDEDSIVKVCSAIGFHTGRFDRHINVEWLEKYAPYRNTSFAQIVNEADYYASRPDVLVKVNQ